MKKSKNFHDPNMAEFEGVKEPRYWAVCTPESAAKIRAKLEAGKGMRVKDTAKYQAAPEKLKRQMCHAAHLRKLRTLRGIWNPEE